MLKAKLKPGERSSDEPWSHPAVECAYVLTGTLTVTVGVGTYEVLSGEAITLDSNQPHMYANNSDALVEFVLSASPPTP